MFKKILLIGLLLISTISEAEDKSKNLLVDCSKSIYECSNIFTFKEPQEVEYILYQHKYKKSVSFKLDVEGKLVVKILDKWISLEEFILLEENKLLKDKLTECNKKEIEKCKGECHTQPLYIGPVNGTLGE